MADNDPTAYELFKMCAPKHREVQWKPAGFAKGNESPCFHFYPSNMNGVTFYQHHSIDIAVAKLDLIFKYDRENSAPPVVQMVDACWAAILEGPFKGRRFYADPIPGAAERMFQSLVQQGSAGQMKICFTHDGDEIAGLSLMSNMKASHWSFFVPSGSLEGRAIEAAVQLEQTKKRQEKLRREEQIFPTVSDRMADLKQALVAAGL